VVTKSKNRGGRPKLDPAEARASTIGVRVSASEYASLRAKAAKMGTTPARWLRVAALDREITPPVPEINSKLYGELGKLAANVHQITRRANVRDKMFFLSSEEKEILQSVYDKVEEVRLALIGKS